MIFSRDRILTTHVGSLPRNETLSDLLMAQEEGKPYDPKVMSDEMDKAVRHVVSEQMKAGIDVGNDGEQRRIGFQTYVPQRMSGFAGVSKRRRGKEFEEFPELLVLSDAPLSESDQEPAGRARSAGRHQVSRPQADQRRDIGIQQDRHRARRIFRAVHDRGLARHHLDHHAQRLLRLARLLSRRDRARDEQGVSGGAQGRADPADRRAGPRDGSHHDVPRSLRQRFRQALRAARRRDQQGDRGHPARPRAAARLLWQLGRAAHPRRSAGDDPARALHRQCRRAHDRVLQSAPRARIRGAEEAQAAGRTCC